MGWGAALDSDQASWTSTNLRGMEGGGGRWGMVGRRGWEGGGGRVVVMGGKVKGVGWGVG